MSDFAVIGAGIVGLAVARELTSRHPEAEVIVHDRESRIAAHQTSHSSGVIHAGIYYEPGSLKARLCVEGARRLYEYCDEKGIPYRRGGKLIVAVDEEELLRLGELERRGRENGVEGLQRLGADAIPGVEPHARGLAALHSPATGSVDFAAVAAQLAEDVKAAGGRIELGAGARRVADLRAGLVINCAGAWSDRLAVADGAPSEPRIVPFRGAYLELKPERRELVRSNIYPVPDPELPFLGAHLTRTIDDRVLLGPTALLAPARDAYRLSRLRMRDLASAMAWPGTARLARRHWRTGLAEVRRATGGRALVGELRRYVPDLRTDDVRPAFAGIRAQAMNRDGTLVDDFVVHRTERALHVRNAPSPAATSALALAAEICDRIG